MNDKKGGESHWNAQTLTTPSAAELREMTSVTVRTYIELLEENLRAHTLGGRLCMAAARLTGRPGVRLASVRIHWSTATVAGHSDFDVFTDGKSVTLDPGARYSERHHEWRTARTQLRAMRDEIDKALVEIEPLAVEQRGAE